MRMRLSVLAASILTISMGEAIAQPAPAYESPLGVLQGQSRIDWVVRMDAFVRPYLTNDPITKNASNGFSFDKVLLVFPMPQGASNAWIEEEPTQARFFDDDIVVDDTPEVLDGYYLGARYLLFDGSDIDAFLLRLSIDWRASSWRLAFDEDRASRVTWPKRGWPVVAQTALVGQQFIDPDDPDVQALVAKWAGKNPRSRGPVELAKFLAARMINNFQPNGLGYTYNSNGLYGGLEIHNIGLSARRMTGSPFDQAALLCALYRAAGLPSRVVLVYDIGASAEGLEIDDLRDRDACQPVERDTIPRNPVIRPFVEFYLYDEEQDAGEWIPVDIERQRQVSSRARPLDQRWEFFGNMPCGDVLLPLAYHFHPPEAVVSPGPPAMWGWLGFPITPRVEQSFNISAWEAPKRASDMP